MIDRQTDERWMNKEGGVIWAKEAEEEREGGREGGRKGRRKEDFSKEKIIFLFLET